ncbi:autotransporter-associated beta strand repeat-containing protein [Chlorobium ferrooxidans]|uniref:Haemagluttinin:Filamentous haemagglutinin-like n=1 Tax=Chlorobium ferrooxidans DSM 13031 TaxID=377431 RepID=Q0YSM5_9CHLB|nr:autotransporter-associated beta strand repeat-containing protein [Chlorobium ferrooxidans]EAT59359.1 Haemagluttinin:Filamentous haemagglutinin-like [Chlorobium ferrooxidans DSM 13031]
MNRVFNIIWSKSKERWIVVSEKVKTSGGVPKSRLKSLAVLIALFASAERAYALDPGSLPSGGVITSGEGTITTSGTQLTVNQSTPQMIANWQSFNIGADAGVRFNQPNSSSAVLNRITDQNPTQIMGSLSANGRVFLLNPSGIIFGSTARVDVGGLVASSLNMLDSDFLSGRYRFSNSGSAGHVINQGTITAMPGGVVALIAPKVTNEGSVSAPGGSVALAGGNQVSLDFHGDGLITLTVDQGAVDALAENKGLIKADGGRVIMTAKAADALVQSVVNNSGIIEARSLQARGGRIILDAEGGMTMIAGKVDASSPDGKGGSVIATGDRVLVKDGAHLTASGATGGGEVLVGGSWQNSDPQVRQATGTIVEQGALLEASAIDTGNGGTVVAWSDVTNPNSFTRAYGTFEAKGGANGGDGGRMETSGHQVEITSSHIDAGSPHGSGGIWLIDPYNYTIDATAATTIVTSLNSGTSVTIDTANSGGPGEIGSGTGNITVDSAISTGTETGTRTLTLTADGSIVVNAAIGNTTGTLDLTLNANGGSISGNGAISGTGTTTFNVGSSSGTYSGIISKTTLVKSGPGTLTLGADNSYTGQTTISAGTLELDATGKIANSSHVSNNGTFTIAADKTIDSISGGGATTLGSYILTIGDGTNSSSAYNGVISGSGGINKAGTGVLLLMGTNTYSGGTTLTSGTLSLGSSGAIGSTGAITFSGGTLQYTASNTTDYSGRFSNEASQSYKVDTNGQDVTLASVLSSSGGTLTKSGSGTLTLSGVNNYTGVTTVSAGTLKLGAAGDATNTPLGTIDGATSIISGATLDLNGFTLGTAEGLTLNGTGVGGTAGALTNSSGSAATYSGLITLGSASSIFSSNGDIIISNSGTITGGTRTLTLGGTASGSSISSIIGNSTGGVTKTGSGTWTLSGNSTFAGLTTISEGTLRLGSAGSGANTPLGTTGNRTVVAEGATLDLNGFSLATAEALTLNGTGVGGTAGALTNSSGTAATYSGLITLGSASSIVANNGNLILSNAGTITGATFGLTLGGSNTGSSLASIIGTGAGTLTKAGAGTWTLGGINTYTGLTTISGGTLSLNATGTIDLSSGVSNGGQFTIAAAKTIDSMTGSGGTALGANTLTIGDASNTSASYSGVISGAGGGITKAGTGTLTLSGENTYTGLTTVSAGTLKLGAAGDATNTPLGTVAGGTTITAGATLDLSGYTLGISEALTLNGTGISGGGALSNSSATSATYSGLVTLGSASSIVSNSGDIILSNTGTITVSSGPGYGLTLGGTSAGSTLASIIGTGNSGTLTKEGSGIWRLTGGNIYADITSINDGEIILSGNGQIFSAQNTAITVNTGARLTLDNTESGTNIDRIHNNKPITLAGGELLYKGSNSIAVDETILSLTLSSGASTVTLNSGTGGGTSLTFGSISRIAGATVLFRGTNLGAAAAAAGNTNLIFTDASGLTLSGSNAGQTTRAIVPYAIGDSNPGGAGTDFVTYNWNSGGNTTNTFGIRPLVATEYATTATDGVNLKIASSASPNASYTINSLLLTGGSTYTIGSGGGAKTLTISSGSIFSASGVANIITGTTTPDLLTFGAEGKIFSVGDLTLSNAVASGSAGLTKSGSGTFTLSSVSTYSGTTTLNAGRLALGAALPNTAVTVNGRGAVLDIGTIAHTVGAVTLNNGTISGTGTLNGTAFTIDNLYGTATISAILTGSGTLTKSGVGTVTLSGANTYTGATTINAGTLQAAHATAMGSTAAGTTVISGATLDINDVAIGDEVLTLRGIGVLGAGALTGSGTASLSGNVVMDTSTPTIGGSGVLTLSGVVSGTGTLTKVGTGTLLLSGANSSYAQTITVSSGTLRASHASALGTTAAGTTVLAGATLDINNVAILAEGLTLDGTGVGGAGALTGTGTASLSGAISLGTSTPTIGGAGILTLSGVISGTGRTLTKVGAGTLILSGAGNNTYTGETTISEGTLRASKAVALGTTAAGTIVRAGATLDINNVAIGAEGLTLDGTGVGGAGALTGTGGASLSGAISLGANTPTVGGAGTLTLSGVISGTGRSLTKVGAGTLTLSGSNTYTGATTISGGTLQASNASALGTNSAVTLSNTANVSLSVNNTLQIGSLAGGGSNGGNVTIGSGVLLTIGGDNSDTAYEGVISGGGITKTGTGTLTLGGQNTFTGGVRINQGTLSVGTIGDGGEAGNLGAAGSSATLLQLGGGTLQYTGTTASTNRSFTITNGTISSIAVTNAGTNLTVTGNSGSSISTGGLTKLGSGTLTMSGSNNYSGLTTISEGTMKLGTQGSSVSSTPLGNMGGGTVVLAGATLDLNGFTLSSSEALTLNGTGVGGAGALINSSGTAATYGGLITLGSSSTIVSNGSIILSNTGTITGAGFGLTLGGTGSASSLAGIIGTGAGSLSKEGSGTWSLSGTNTYSGSTTITAGTLKLDGSGTLGSGSYASNILNSGAFVVNSSSAQTLSGIVSGTGTLTKSGTGTLTLSGTNTYDGGTTISTGTLIASNAQALGTAGTLTMAGSTTLSATENLNLGTRGVTLTGSSTLNVAETKTLTAGGVITDGDGSFGLTKSGSGTLTLSGTNTYDGGTTISAGTLIASNAQALGTAGSLTMAGSTTLSATENLNLGTRGVTLTGSSTLNVAETKTLTAGGVITDGDGSFGLTKSGAGTLTLSGTNTYDGGTTVSGGVLSIGEDRNLGNAPGLLTSNSLKINAGTLATRNSFTLNTLRGITLTGAGTLDTATGTTLTYGGVITDGGSSFGLTKSGAGTLTLSGTNTYTGGTTVSTGTLSIGAGGASGSISDTGTLSNSGAVVFNRSDDFTYSGKISGAGSLTKSGNGTLTLSGTTSDYTGAVTVSVGTLKLGHVSALGTTAGGVTVSNTATLDLNGISIGDEALTLNGLGVGGTAGALTNSSITASTYSGLISLASGSRIVSNTGTALTLSGTINGGYALGINGSGSVTLGGTIGNSTSLASFTGDAATTLVINGASITTTGNQTYNGDTTFGRAAGTALTTTSNGSITSTGANGKMTATAGSLSLAANGTGDIDFSNVLNDFSIVTVTDADAVSLVDKDDLTVSGIAASGTVDVSTQSGDLTLTGNLSTTDGSATAIRLNAGKSATAGASVGTDTGGNIIVTGSPSITVGAGGVASFYTGSISGSTGLSAFIGTGTGRFRYNSDESASNYTTVLAAGKNAIYREKPTVTVTAANETITYGTAPTLDYTISGEQNSDTKAQALSGGLSVSGSTSSSGKYTAGTHTIGQSGLTSLLGYGISYVSKTLTVDQKQLQVTAIGDGSSTYGNSLVYGAVMDNRITGDVLDVTRTLVNASLSTSGNTKVGSYKQKASGITGTDSANYSWGGDFTTATENYAISRANLTVSGLSASNKVYDATTTATLTGTARVTPIGSDVVTLGGTPTGAFADKNVGTGKTVTVTGSTISGADAANYNLLQQSALNAEISRANLTVSGLSASNKVYDATTTATLTGTARVTPLGSDVVTLGGTPTGAFADKNIGTGKEVTVTGSTISGADAANYNLLQQSALSAEISRANLTVSGLTASNKVYDATTTATLRGTAKVTPLGSDVVTLGGTPAGTFADRNVGTGKSVTVTGSTISGADAANYNLQQQSGLTADISEAPVTDTESKTTSETVLPIITTTPASPAGTTLSSLMPPNPITTTAPASSASITVAPLTITNTQAVAPVGSSIEFAPVMNLDNLSDMKSGDVSSTVAMTTGGGITSDISQATLPVTGSSSGSEMQKPFTGVINVFLGGKLVRQTANAVIPLPDEIKTGLTQGVGGERVTLLNGSQLPSWISYNSGTRTFKILNAPSETFHIKVRVQDQSRSWVVDIASNKSST